jgi:hypothetical protein
MTRIRRYDAGFGRRTFTARLARGLLASGVLMPLWKAIAADGDVAKAYPEELLSLDAWTRGRIAAGATITADNVEQVRDLLDPIQYLQVAQMGRRLEVIDTTTDVLQLSPPDYVEATLRHRGRARFAPDGNVVTDDGRPWIGGNPFPEPRDGLEVFAGITLSWGRHDAALYATREYDLDDAGELAYEYQSCWVEMSPVGRLRLEPKPYWTGHEDRLRYQSVLFVAPHDVRGTSFLNVWHYDQNRYPELFGYLPAFKRVRRFPTNQRFEPLIPGSTLYLSDAWAAGDPLLTWGNYRIVHQGPMLAAVSRSWNGAHPNWEHTTHGGAKGKTFWDTAVEFVPEAIVVEAEPLKFPRAPVSRKRVWFDARTLLPLSMVSYDWQGKIFRSFDGAFSRYEAGANRVADGPQAYWSWTRVHAHDVQTNRITRLEQVRELPGGYRSSVNDPAIYETYLTQTALTRLGA